MKEKLRSCWAAVFLWVAFLPGQEQRFSGWLKHLFSVRRLWCLNAAVFPSARPLVVTATGLFSKAPAPVIYSDHWRIF
ncbi:hypothetical protein predicted by Glimmer/Critica [Acetobacter senegalensis]|uniref:Uncharacterized protein n=1 Tax=Acetobacter senegalensis TaxID=446692 RepID=A0A0U5EW56_9PROT|nr:hypothetical protein predicted by Glimmer/Critica [Acetobacter senegalensis]